MQPGPEIRSILFLKAWAASMFSYDNPDGCAAIAQMNSELQHAQLELLSAHCASHQLRLHYSADDLANFGRRDILRKSVEAASALHDFYSSIERKIPQTGSSLSPQLTSAQISQAVQCVSTYLAEQRQQYLRTARPLSNPHKALMWPYFSPTL